MRPPAWIFDIAVADPKSAEHYREAREHISSFGEVLAIAAARARRSTASPFILELMPPAKCTTGGPFSESEPKSLGQLGDVGRMGEQLHLDAVLPLKVIDGKFGDCKSTVGPLEDLVLEGSGEDAAASTLDSSQRMSR